MNQDREYQTRTITEARQAVVRGTRRILIVLPTGAGKSRIAARMMQLTAEKDRSSAFFAAQRELIFQIQNQLTGLGTASRILMAGVHNEFESNEDHWDSYKCHLIAKDTLWARAFNSDKIAPPDADVIHIDEAHGAISKTYQSIAQWYSESVSIGWTATPCRTDGRLLGDYYDHLIQGATYKELQDLGFLVPVRVFVPNRPDLTGVDVVKGDYNKSQLQTRMNKDSMVGSIVDEWRKHSQGRSTVAFLSGIDHSKHVADEFAKLLGSDKVGHVDGYMEQSERDDILDAAKDGKIQVVCNYGVVTQGVDVPRWKYMIVARPTKSFLLHRQMGGRIQRPWNSEEAMIQDHTDNTLEFGYPDEDVAWTLEKSLKAQDLSRTARNSLPNEPKPRLCSCGCEYRGRACPACGLGAYRAENASAVDMQDGELAELKRQRIANRKATLADKQAAWDECFGIAINRGMKIGAAAHMYKKRFGVFPNSDIQNTPRSSQWKMTAKEFYTSVVKPSMDDAKRQSREEAEAVA